MKNILIYSDLHINQSSIKECIQILEEIGMLANKYNVDTLINLGDTFDGLKPSSQEMDIFATFIRRLGNDKQHIILAADSHESTTQEESILNHYGILSDNVRIVKEYKDQNHILCLHEYFKESSKNFGAKRSKEDVKNYVYVFTGHLHSYEVLKPNICHLGSCRWVNFDESKDKHKVVAIISDYCGDNESVHFLGLKAPIKMIEFILKSNNNKELQEKDPKNVPKSMISGTILPKNEEMGKDLINSNKSILQGENPSNPSQIDLLCQQLDKLDPKTKVKVKIMDFLAFRKFLPFVNKYSAKFEVFKYSTEFNVVSDLTPKNVESQKITFKESFTNYLKNQKIDPKIAEILKKEVE